MEKCPIEYILRNHECFYSNLENNVNYVCAVCDIRQGFHSLGKSAFWMEVRKN